jgi:hypothetical protein
MLQPMLQPVLQHPPLGRLCGLLRPDTPPVGARRTGKRAKGQAFSCPALSALGRGDMARPLLNLFQPKI